MALVRSRRPVGCRGTLRFFESGASLQTENLWVKCDPCGASRNMAQAFGQAGRDNLPACRGRHPHIDQFDDGCKEEPRPSCSARRMAGSRHAFGAGDSARPDPIAQLVQDGWDYFDELTSEAEVAVVVKTLKKTAQLPGIEKHSPKAIWEAIEAIQTGTAGTGVDEADLKGPEWEVLTRPQPSDRLAAFHEQEVGVPRL